MRQNTYDDAAFFRGYAELWAGPCNLNDLVEQPALRGAEGGACGWGGH